ncbi:unnamed protein product, partial [Vitis vinifera]
MRERLCNRNGNSF